MESATIESAIAIAAAKLVEPFEGFRAEPYRDPAGVWTIGFGSTRDGGGMPVSAATGPVTRQQALLLVERDLVAASMEVQRHVTVPLNANQQAALIDFVYNLGAGNFRASTLLRLLNAGDFTQATGQFARWD
ncbi:MAG TPA: lysozyme, partial [Acidiphilium sp.]